MAGAAEQTAISFNTLIGNAERADQLFRDLDKFSIDTPFEPTEINNAAKTLLGFGRSADIVLSDLNLIGNASAATGANLQSLAVVFGQVAGTGKLAGQDALQFINQGIPVYQLLSESLGKSVKEIKKLQEDGKITFDVLREAFAKASKELGKTPIMAYRSIFLCPRSNYLVF
ncbi:MAG: tape measure protein [Saprospiraceae bacterium]|nr:tape measure protein [Saprospiraceae bacterium]